MAEVSTSPVAPAAKPSSRTADGRSRVSIPVNLSESPCSGYSAVFLLHTGCGVFPLWETSKQLQQMQPNLRRGARAVARQLGGPRAAQSACAGPDTMYDPGKISIL